MKMKHSTGVKNFKEILSGGDLRSKGQSDKIVSLIDNQQKFDELFSLLFHTDRIVVMRATDAIEKITLHHPEFLTTHKKEILQLCSEAENIEFKWHLALLVPRLKLTKQELGKVWQILSDWATDKKESKIVRVDSLQGLFDLLIQSKELNKDLQFTLSKIEKENVPSLNARIRKIRKEMAVTKRSLTLRL
jgi:hypothetical protein